VNWQAKIITMSFGFPQLDRDIRTAIKYARLQDVLFFVAASNLGGNEDTAFPAKHSEVISIRATCGEGNFAGFNPNPDPDLPNFGTLGEAVSSAWLSTQGDSSRKTGTSIATPIAAGLAAVVLEYVGAKLAEDRWLSDADKYDLWWKANTLSGMRIMFQILAGTAREAPRCFYVAPWNLGADWVWDAIKSRLKKEVS
jgi:subtilisin family serine protease